MDELQEGWERDYSRRGRRFARAPESLPCIHPHSRVLEAGCGDGKTLRALANRVGPVTGESLLSPEIVAFDFSDSAIRLCAAGIVGRSRIHLLAADAARMPFRDGSFDNVLLFHLLGHAPAETRQRIADEAFRVTRQGGSIHVRVFSRNDFRAGSGTVVEPWTYLRGDGIFTHYFTTGEVCSLYPMLTPSHLEEVSWSLRVRGEDLRREEIHAVFRAGGEK